MLTQAILSLRKTGWDTGVPIVPNLKFFRIALLEQWFEIPAQSLRVSQKPIYRNVKVALIRSLSRKTIPSLKTGSRRIQDKTTVSSANRIVLRDHVVTKAFKANESVFRRRCEWCRLKKKESRTIWICSTCNVPLGMSKTRNCFELYHSRPI